MIYILMLPLLVLSACSKGEYLGSEEILQPREALTLRVSAADFAADGIPDTRATDNGVETTFEKGDRVGIIVLDADGNIATDNVPYKYNGSGWVFDDSNSENKSSVTMTIRLRPTSSIIPTARKRMV